VTWVPASAGMSGFEKREPERAKQILTPSPKSGRIILINPVHGEGARIQAPERDGAVVERVRLEV